MIAAPNCNSSNSGTEEAVITELESWFDESLWNASDNGVAVFVNSNANPLSLVMGPEAADRFEVLTMDGPSMR